MRKSAALLFAVYDYGIVASPDCVSACPYLLIEDSILEQGDLETAADSLVLVAQVVECIRHGLLDLHYALIDLLAVSSLTAVVESDGVRRSSIR